MFKKERHILQKENFILILFGIINRRDKASAFAFFLPDLCLDVKVYSCMSIIHLINFFDNLVDFKIYYKALLSV